MSVLNIYDPTQWGSLFIEDFVKQNNLEELRKEFKKTICDIKKTNRPLTISICSEKGGVGKSTITLLLSQFLANLGFNILVLDVDALQTSYKGITERKERIQESLSELETNEPPEDKKLEFVKNIEPSVYAITMEKNTFSPHEVENLYNNYDILIIDSAGIKKDTIGNFDLRKLEAPGEPQITTAYISHSLVIPTKAGYIDLNAAVSYYSQVKRFIETIEDHGKNKMKTVPRLLPSIVERTGSGLALIEDAKEETSGMGFKFFETGIRRFERISSCDFSSPRSALSNKTNGTILAAIVDIAKQINIDVKTGLDGNK